MAAQYRALQYIQGFSIQNNKKLKREVNKLFPVTDMKPLGPRTQ